MMEMLMMTMTIGRFIVCFTLRVEQKRAKVACVGVKTPPIWYDDLGC